MPDKYVDIWKSKADNAPKQSIIGSLQKLLTEKDEQIYTLTNQLNALKERMAENVNVMEEMEKQFVEQKSRIEYLEESGGSGAPKVLKPNISAGPSPPIVGGGDKQTVDKLRKQVSEMENKMYIMAQLPDRIQDLESKLEKQNKQLEQYEENEGKLRDTIRKLSADGSSEVMQEMEDKLQKQAHEIARLQSQAKSTGEEEASESSDSRQLQDQIDSLKQERASNNTKIEDLNKKNQELLAKLETSRRTVMNLQSQSPLPIPESDEGAVQNQERVLQLEAAIAEKDNLIQELKTKIEYGSSSTSSQDELGDLKLQNQKIQKQLDETKEKLKQQQLKMEQIVENAQKAGKGQDLAAKVMDLTSKLDDLKKENAQIKENLANKDKLLSKQAGGDLIQQLNTKVERLTAMNKKMEDELKKAKIGASADSGKVSGSGKAGPSAPQIHEVSSKSSKESDSKSTQEIAQLHKQLAEKETELAKTSKELTDSQTQLAQMKAAGPQDTGSGNMMSLLTDLQTRIKKMKEEMRKKDEEIARLKGQ